MDGNRGGLANRPSDHGPLTIWQKGPFSLIKCPFFEKSYILKQGTTQNYPKRGTTTQNEPQPATTTQNDPQPE